MRFHTSSVLLMIFTIAISCGPKHTAEFITVSGVQPAAEMGKTLSHEHLLVDFIGADSTGYHRWEREAVVEKVLPYLEEIKALGYQTLMDCTPAYLGRDPRLLRELAEKSGLQILTNTGYYCARENKYLPAHAFEESAEQLAARWIAEFENGIEDSGVRPGFIKISIDPGAPLSEVQAKIVRAAALTHRQTGLPIASHTGPAAGAFAQLEILEREEVSPGAWIWVHAQNADTEDHIRAARMGAWISLDNVSDQAERIESFIQRLAALKDAGVFDRVLISHDAGWYRPGEPDGGAFRPFTAIERHLAPALEENGFTEADVRQLLYDNPARAFALREIVGK